MTKYDLEIVNRKLSTPKYDFSYFNVRNNAWDFLIKNHITSYPLDLRYIAINNNWNIWSYRKYCEIRKIDYSDLIKTHPDGFTEIIDNKIFICYNEQNNKQRNRFTICHEIGHIVLKHLYKGDKLDKEANMFAARILMPMILIKELNIQSPIELAKLCDVSIDAASYRLKRFNDIKLREKFYTNPKEKNLYLLLKPYIQTQHNKKRGYNEN